ncbi:MAG: prealbumin-like fold domain-containing protein [Lachnospiraceae bacterium]|nr:prealbumin-like fold domain-containing protein [Lachnospiraceae bacterium]
MKRRKIIIFILIIVVVIASTLSVCYFSQRDWCGAQGWSGEYNEDSATMVGVESMELMCSVNTRIIYSYAIRSGGAEVKITRDAEGKDVVQKAIITEDNSDGTITFDNTEPEIYYLYETALSEDSDYFGEGSYEVYRTKWKQMLLRLAFRYGIDTEQN